jgi:hypothetical protein
MEKSVDIYNGENVKITVVTDLETVIIPGKSSTVVKMSEDAWYAGDFHVEEEGNWYTKTGTSSGADLEIHSCS